MRFAAHNTGIPIITAVNDSKYNEQIEKRTGHISSMHVRQFLFFSFAACRALDTNYK